MLKRLIVGWRPSSETTKEKPGRKSSVLLLPSDPPHLEVELLQPLIALWRGFMEPEEKLGPTPDDQQQLAAAPVSFSFQESRQQGG